MKIAQLTPGSGDNFYCENCLRDTELVKALRRQGHEILLIPMYLPLQTDTEEEKVSNAPIFFGGINVYLQQKFTLFRKTPRWLDRLFDSPKLLHWIGRKSHMTSAEELGQTTVSMLQGENGRQIKELERLVNWLAEKENKPDVVCLSNALLAGLAKPIKETLRVPVVCLLQDEDTFLDKLPLYYAKQAWQIISERCKQIDAFISVSKHFAAAMQQMLKLDKNKVHTIYPGIALQNYQPQASRPKVPAIGFLSSMSKDKGLDILVEAFILLKKIEKFRNVRLLVSGGQTGHDKAFIKRIRRKLKDSNLTGDVEFLPDFDLSARLEFLKNISVLSVPERRSPAFGLYFIESLACGVPVAQPDTGVFAEILGQISKDMLYKPNNPEALAETLEKILSDDNYADRLGSEGRRAVIEKFNADKSARELVSIFEKL